MPAPSAKNLLLTPAFQSLGLGDQLVQQVDDQEEERKKKLLQLNQPGNPFQNASSVLFGRSN